MGIARPLFLNVILSYHDNFGAMVMLGYRHKDNLQLTEGMRFKLKVMFLVVKNRGLIIKLEHSDKWGYCNLGKIYHYSIEYSLGRVVT